MPWVTAEAVDDDDKAVPFGQSGALRFRTPFAVSGYWQEDGTLSQLTRNGWIYSGDVGIVGAGGYLQLLGRIDDRINIGGHKVNPAKIESIINSHASVLESAVVKIEAPAQPLPLLTAAIVLIDNTASVAASALQEIHDLLSENLDVPSHPSWLCNINVLPKNAGGKVNRQKLTALLTASITASNKDTH